MKKAQQRLGVSWGGLVPPLPDVLTTMNSHMPSYWPTESTLM